VNTATNRPGRFRTDDGLILAGDLVGDPRDPAVVLLHGGGQTRHSWERAAGRLARAGYYVVNYDARGHGESEWARDGNYGLGALAGDLPAALIGASMGGMTAFYAVGGSPRPIARALVLVDIVLRPSRVGVERIQAFMRANPTGFASLAEAADAVARYNPDRRRPNDPGGLRKNLRLREDGRFHWHWDPRLLDAEPSAEPPTFSEELAGVSGGVTVPTLLIRGGRSDMVDEAGTSEMASLVPQLEVLDVPGASHMVAGDRNDEFATGILSYLQRVHPSHR
jgi:pimeloyl-ACP methyl ester carboxylesterase